MVELTVQIPESLARLPDNEREALIRAGLHVAVSARRRELEAEIATATDQIRHFEVRYGLSLAQFEREVLPTLDSLQAHENYNDWFFWDRVLAEKKQLLADLQHPDLI
ncbi:MAG: hypothetical protein M5U01_24825 [Ardenticatenaceae bacterium]|nr:hypothetical protein [Ardenticatenaceae bacterium]